MKLCSGKAPGSHAQRAVILLEVVLALGLFVAAAAVFTVSINSSMASLERQRLSLHAENLASSLLAEVQMGARAPAPGETALDAAHVGWTAELAVAPLENDLLEIGHALSHVEAVVRHTNGMVKRLAQAINLASPAQEPALP